MIRLLGTCPVCERQQRVTPKREMVHHGFRRPGWGAIVGDCFGVGYPPYELSSEGCVAYQRALAKWRKDAEGELRRYQDRPEQISSVSLVSKKTLVFRRDSSDTEERRRYERELESLIGRIDYGIKQLDRAHRRMTELINGWAPAPLQEIDEEGLTPVKRSERESKKAERDAARSEKQQKQSALQARRNTRLAQKATALLFFFDEFERLSRLPPSPARDMYARDLLFELSKKKHGLSYPWDLFHGPDDGYGRHVPGPWGRPMMQQTENTLVALGVATREANRARVVPVYASCGNKITVPEPNGSAEEVLDNIARMTIES